MLGWDLDENFFHFTIKSVYMKQHVISYCCHHHYGDEVLFLEEKKETETK